MQAANRRCRRPLGRGTYNATACVPISTLLPDVTRSIIVPYSASEMYAVADDVDSYCRFLPWCSESEVLERCADEAMARVGIAYHGWQTSFTTRNRMVAGRSIEMRLLAGRAFHSLEGDWRFRPLDEAACEVELQVRFSLAGKLGDRVLGPVFSRICTELVDAFVARAKELYGERAFA
tara:strand:- start:7647 stop:8180 length:534 start_codon:yes stop_codon:yes gene_type:complete